ncbi:MAG TPA: hypothetical protein VEX60_12395 [Pyrinomonadaceae bacterium]|nr:hypothetical protein [Pyrinomonadaceae bacterium]
MPEAARLPAFDALKLGINAEAEEAESEEDERREGKDARGDGMDDDEIHADRDEVAARTPRSKQRRRR